MQPNSSPVIWLITDGKAGHKNQLKGLGNRLKAVSGGQLHWISSGDYKVSLWRAALGVPPALKTDLPEPDLIAAAGTQTHRLLLALRRRARTLVIMKPVFPLALVDAAIIPAHDRVRPGKKVLVTQGVINAVTPMARLTDSQRALILIGGPSRHFQWREDRLKQQILALIADYPHWQWHITDSRRTPHSLSGWLTSLSSAQVHVYHHSSTHDGWVTQQIASSKAIWVTPDSISMICEAVTSGVPTGLLELPALDGSRVATGVDSFVTEGLVAQWRDHSAVMNHSSQPTKQFWEAQRAAEWVNRTLLEAGH